MFNRPRRAIPQRVGLSLLNSETLLLNLESDMYPLCLSEKIVLKFLRPLIALIMDRG